MRDKKKKRGREKEELGGGGKAKKRLLFIIWSYSYGGGAEKVLSHLTAALDPARYDIDILEYWHGGAPPEKTAPHVTLLPPILDERKSSRLKKGATYLALLAMPWLLRRRFLCGREPYDFEISFNYLIPTFLLSRKRSAKTVAWVHGDVYDLRENRFNRFLQAQSFSRVDRIVAISRRTYDSLREVYPKYQDKLRVIYNAFPLKTLDTRAAELPLPPKTRFTFLFVGRLDENKNPLFLIDVLARLRERGADCFLVLVGEGAQRARVEAEAAAKNLTGNVALMGYRANPYPYFLAADALLLCSASEGFPTVLVEGLHFGKPFVSTDVGGVEELSDGGRCGFVARNQDEFVEYAYTLLTDPVLYRTMSDHARTHAERFGEGKQASSLEALFREIDAERGEVSA